MYPEFVYVMTKAQYQFYFTETGGRVHSKEDLCNYITSTYGLFGKCVDIKVED